MSLLIHSAARVSATDSFSGGRPCWARNALMARHIAFSCASRTGFAVVVVAMTPLSVDAACTRSDRQERALIQRRPVRSVTRARRPGSGGEVLRRDDACLQRPLGERRALGML